MKLEAGSVHRIATRLTSAVLVVLGIVMVIMTLANGGGPLAVGFLFGIVLVAVGAARLWLARDEEQGS